MIPPQAYLHVARYGVHVEGLLAFAVRTALHRASGYARDTRTRLDTTVTAAAVPTLTQSACMVRLVARAGESGQSGVRFCI